MAKTFMIWAGGDSHVATDLKHGRRSLADAIEQSESDAGFDWDIMLDCGDTSGSQPPPDDEEGRKVVEQYGVLRKHDRARIYNVAGNHDASGPNEPVAQWWFQKYLDPLGENTRYSGVDPAKRPFAVEGKWDRYAFTCGNVRVLMMSDRNDGGPPIGRGEKGGYPAGAVTGETFDWWVDQVETHQDKIIICMHHHMLKATTVASGDTPADTTATFATAGRWARRIFIGSTAIPTRKRSSDTWPRIRARSTFGSAGIRIRIPTTRPAADRTSNANGT
jgi:hypothetical protein